MAAVGSRLYLLGGAYSSYYQYSWRTRTYSNLDQFDIPTSAWSSGPAMVRERRKVSARARSDARVLVCCITADSTVRIDWPGGAARCVRGEYCTML